jgi:hypothetical protein
MPVLPVSPTQPSSRQKYGALQVMGLKDLTAAEDQQRQQLAQSSQTISDEEQSGLSGIIRRQWEIFQRHRNTNAGWSWRMLSALRQFNGQYDPQVLAEINAFGGSTIYARLTATKCRGATSLLRDIYIAQDRPWGLEASSDPDIPVEVFTAITQQVQSEIMNVKQAGQPLPSLDDVRDRTYALIELARNAAKKKSTDKARLAEDKIEAILQEGGFYIALGEYLVDLAIYPLAFIKGPVVKIVQTVSWHNGVAYIDMVPRLTWARVSPFDVWFTPGVADIVDADVVERSRITRAQLNDCLDLPGYDHDNVRSVLRDYSRGYTEAPDFTDAQRAVLESRESPQMNESWMLDQIEFHGNVQGQVLIDAGVPERQIPDPLRDYGCAAWMIGRYLIKVQLNPSVRKRHPYYCSSFEKIPGTPVGNALPDTIGDLQDGANAAFRAIVNNMAMSSGPQVVVHDDRLSGGENGDQMYPWKRWHVISDPLGNSSATVPPVDFFQPQNNTQALTQVFEMMYTMADDVSAIPRYLQGGAAGGAGRTASGLAMLMGNASKVLQTVCGNTDTDVILPNLRETLDMLLLTDQTGMLEGDEKVVAKGVQIAMQRETMRSRQLELLQVTANPVDMQIIGPKGRAALLRAVTQNVGIPGDEIVPSDEEIEGQVAAAKAQAAQQGIPGHAMGPPDGAGGGPGQAQGGQPTAPSGQQGPRTSIMPSRAVAGGVGGSP